LSTSWRVHTDTGTPVPPALGLVTISRPPVTSAVPEVVIGGLLIRLSGIFGYWPTVCTSVLPAFSPGMRATLTKVTRLVLVSVAPWPLPQGMPVLPAFAGARAKQTTGATP
jgi:hypothetical protein